MLNSLAIIVIFYRNLRESWSEDAPKHQNDVLDDVLENSIVELLKENPSLSQKQLAEETGSSIATVQRAMKKLIDKGKIVREGGKRFGYWTIK